MEQISICSCRPVESVVKVTCAHCDAAGLSVFLACRRDPQRCATAMATETTAWPRAEEQIIFVGKLDIFQCCFVFTYLLY